MPDPNPRRGAFERGDYVTHIGSPGSLGQVVSPEEAWRSRVRWLYCHPLVGIAIATVDNRFLNEVSPEDAATRMLCT